MSTNRRLANVIVVLLAAGSAETAFAEQAPKAAPVACVLTWVDHEPGIEAYLRSATVAKMDSVPIGVTRPKRAFFTPGGLVSSAAWKPLPPGRRGGYYESYKSEIAAYELDKLLGMHMVPPVVERRIETETGAVVLWVEPVTGWNMNKRVKGPEPEWSRQVSRMKLFDQLIANIDRNQGNLLYDADWHLLLIDHSRAFTDRVSLSGMAPPTWIDRGLWTRMNTLTIDDLQKALGDWLDTRALEAMLGRRDLMRKAIEKRVAQRGERSVFLP